jgi:hypothetical protein
MTPTREKVEEALKYFEELPSYSFKRQLDDRESIRNQAILFALAQSVIDGSLVEPASEEEIAKIISHNWSAGFWGIAHALSGNVGKKIGLSREELMGALARGYCTKRNEDKITDPNLIEDMATEVEKIFSAHSASPKVCPEPKKEVWLCGMCEGSGIVADEDGKDGQGKCPKCSGTGSIPKEAQKGMGKEDK